MKSFLIGLLAGIAFITLFFILYFPNGFFDSYFRGDPDNWHHKLSMKEAVNKFSYEEENNIYIVENGFEVLKVELSEKRQIKKIICFNYDCESFDLQVPSSSKLPDFKIEERNERE